MRVIQIAESTGARSPAGWPLPDDGVVVEWRADRHAAGHPRRRPRRGVPGRTRAGARVPRRRRSRHGRRDRRGQGRPARHRPHRRRLHPHRRRQAPDDRRLRAGRGADDRRAGRSAPAGRQQQRRRRAGPAHLSRHRSQQHAPRRRPGPARWPQGPGGEPLPARSPRPRHAAGRRPDDSAHQRSRRGARGARAACAAWRRRTPIRRC